MIKLKRVLKDNYRKIGILVAVLFILAVSCLNKFPSGYIFSGGDSYQCVDCGKFADNLLKYSWQNSSLGGGNISQGYYFFYYFLSNLQKLVGYGNIVVCLYFLFLFFSFLSFRISLKMFFGKNSLAGDIMALLYAFSPMVFWFYAVFNFGHLLLYALIPLIFSFLYKYFQEEKLFNKYLGCLGIVLFLSNTAFANAPLFTALNIFIALFILLICVFDKNFKTKIIYFIKKCSIFYLLFFLITFVVIIPQLPTLLAVSDALHSGTSSFNLGAWVLWATVKLTDLFFLTPSLQFNMEAFSSLIVIPGAIILLFLFLAILKNNRKRLILIFVIMMIAAMFLSNKGKSFLSEKMVISIFTSNIVLSSLRSHDKTTIFVSFFVLIPVAYYVFQNKKRLIAFSLLVLPLYVISIYPFLLGRLNTNYLALEKGKDYLESSTATIVKIPKDYLELSDSFENKKDDFKILNLPWDALNSPGWVNYPKWKMIGSDPTTHLFNQPTINVSSSLDNWTFSYSWNNQDIQESKWILPLSGWLNAKYLIYHKDSPDSVIQQSEDKISYYENNHLIKKIIQNEYFDLYQINSNYFLPHFYVPASIIVSLDPVEKSVETIFNPDYQTRSAVYFQNQNLSRQLTYEKIKTLADIGNKDIKEKEEKINTLVIEYKKINPTKYRVIIHHAQGEFPLVFSESFNDGWKSYLVNDDTDSRLPASPAKRSEHGNDMSAELSDYKILDGNADDQATADEVQDFITKGYISTLGNLKEQNIKHLKWVDNKEVFDYNENYKINFISKNFQATIQNDNLEPGSFYETWFKKPVADNRNHLMVNGYANSWNINPTELCGVPAAEALCVRNADGSYDLELVVEFWPQRLFYIGLFISGATLFGCLGYLGLDFVRRKKKINILTDKI